MSATTIPPWIPPVTPADGLAGQEDVRKITATTAAISSVLPLAYGEVQIGGKIFAATYANSTWYIGAAFCLGEIDSYQNLYLNDVSVYPTPPSGVTVTYYTGTTSQTANSTLASVLSGYTDTLVVSTPRGNVGVAYVVITYSDSAYSGFPRIVARIRGRKVYAKAGNLLTFSEDLTGTGWADSNTARTANVVTAPDQTTTADKLDETAVNANHFCATPIVASGAVADYDVCTFSVYVKAAERTFVRVGLLIKTGNISTITVNLSTGAITGRAGTYFIDGGAMPVGNGWYRVYVVSNVQTGATLPRGRVQIMLDAATASYLGVAASGIYVWGAQLERKASPGIYTATGATAATPAYTANPALMLRDLITDRIAGVGDDIDDVSVQSVFNECEAVVISAKRRQAGLVLSTARSSNEWIDTLATYAGCWAFSRGSEWVLAADRPPLLWQFTGSDNGFVGSNATLTTGATALTVTQTAGDVFLTSPSGLNICGSTIRYIRARIRRTSGSSTVEGSIFFQTASHPFIEAFKAVTTWTAANGTWVTLEWDMHQPFTGGVDFRESIITRLRFDLSQSAGTDVWEIDWIAVGIKPLTYANIIRESVRVSIADPAQTPSIVTVKYTDTTPTIWRERTAQSALTGVSLGTVIPRESSVLMPGITAYAQAKREATERLNKLQRTAQIELSMFDEGLAYETGDVVSLIHAFAGTAAAAENDASTLYRIISGPRISSPGRADFRLAPYADLDYDNTEPTTTWNANISAIGGINAPRSGDGINRVPSRFSGGFGSVDYDGVFPVAKGVNVTYASVTSGTAPDPTAGFYGTYAIKVTTATSGTDRAVWFGSTSADYSVPIDPYSRWLFSCKYWPRAANTSVTFTFKTAATTRTLTDTTNTASAWNDFVHTADQQNVFDLSSDANVLGLLGVDVTATNTTVWFDGLMLEKQVSNGAIVSAWRPPVASSLNPTRISPRTVGPGTLDDSIALDDGAGNARTIVAGAFSGTATDGQVITFTPAYGRVPTVTFSPSALTYATGAGFGSTVAQTLVCEARSLSTTGFTAYIKVRTTATTVTARTDTTPTDAGAGVVPRYLIQKAASAAEAWDDRYTFTVTVVVKNIRVGEPGAPSFEPGQVIVACYIATADTGSPNFTPTWTKVGTITAGGAGGNNSTTTRTGLTLTVVRDGLTQRGGTTAEFGIAIESELNPGGSVTFTSVTYETATTGPTETSGTAAGVSPVPFMVVPV